uniref:Metastriate one of each protein family n=1 Tax=Rhipicephalus zambeziensis TaxID=60191 RepID=A0A224YEZ1_9ACAR
MGLAKLLGVVAVLASSCGAMVYRTDTSCDFTGVTIDDEVFSRLIAKIPENMESGPQGYHTLLPGFEIGGLTAVGVNKLQKYGPAIPYCTNGTRMVQADFFSNGDTLFWSPWKTCSGAEGRIRIRADFTRFTLQFRVVDTDAEGVKLEYYSALPVDRQAIRISVDGAGRGVRGAFEILSMLMPSFMEEIWTMEFMRNINRAFREFSE